VTGRNKVIKIRRDITFQEISGNSAFKNLSLKPSGMIIEEKTSRRMVVQTQSLLLGRVEKEFTRRNFVKEISSFSEGMTILPARFMKV